MSRDERKCCAEAAGYDGMFGVYCELPEGHDGPHDDGYVRWEFSAEHARALGHAAERQALEAFDNTKANTEHGR